MLSAFSSLRITPAIRQPIVMEQAKRYATKKMGASKARQKKRPPGKRLGLKKYPGEQVGTGNVIFRQRLLKNYPGKNVAMGTDNTLYALMPGYVHITHDPVTNRNYINVVDRNPLEVGMPKEHTEEFTSKLAGGWRNDEIFTRDADGNRVCTLVNLKALPPVESWDLSAVDFDPMAAHLKATGLDVKLAKQ